VCLQIWRSHRSFDERAALRGYAIMTIARTWLEEVDVASSFAF